MAGKKRKWYVVWRGYAPGIYDNWAACERAVRGYPGAQFKGYESESAARAAFSGSYDDVRRLSGSGGVSRRVGELAGGRVAVGGPQLPSVCVDAACNMRTGVMEYRCVDVETGALYFSRGPFYDTTINVGEFLALVEAIAFLNHAAHRDKGALLPIYSDSRTALAWVRERHARTTMSRTAKNGQLFDLIARAEAWLKRSRYANPLLKWETRAWGEIPADYGRK